LTNLGIIYLLWFFKWQFFKIGIFAKYYLTVWSNNTFIESLWLYLTWFSIKTCKKKKKEKEKSFRCDVLGMYYFINWFDDKLNHMIDKSYNRCYINYMKDTFTNNQKTIHFFLIIKNDTFFFSIIKKATMTYFCNTNQDKNFFSFHFSFKHYLTYYFFLSWWQMNISTINHLNRIS